MFRWLGLYDHVCHSMKFVLLRLQAVFTAKARQGRGAESAKERAAKRQPQVAIGARPAAGRAIVAQVTAPGRPAVLFCIQTVNKRAWQQSGKVNGVACFLLSFDLHATISGMSAGGSGKAWVGTADGLPHQLDAASTTNSTGFQTNLVYSCSSTSGRQSRRPRFHEHG